MKDLKRHARLAFAWGRHGLQSPGGPGPLWPGQAGQGPSNRRGGGFPRMVTQATATCFDFTTNVCCVLS
jgi:hypothetical protein